MIQPRGPRLLIKRIEAAKPETELIIIPETAIDKPSQHAIVFAIGTLIHGGISIGDIIIVKDFCGTPVYVTLPGDDVQTECSLVLEDDCLAVVGG